MLSSKLFSFGWFVLLSLCFAAAESRWPANVGPKLVHRLHNFAIAIVVAGVMTLVTGAISCLPGVHVPSVAGFFLGELKPTQVSEIALFTFAYAIIWDFFQYWAHRLQHSVPILWETHALHHDDERLNATTALRFPVLTRFVNFFLVTVPTVAICGGDLLNIYGSVFLLVSWNFFNHANIRLDLGWLTPIISGPQWHRLHHGRDDRYHGKNFAAFFPVWDIVFGTYLAPQKQEYPLTGLPGRQTLPSSLPALLRPIFSMRS